MGSPLQVVRPTTEKEWLCIVPEQRKYRQATMDRGMQCTVACTLYTRRKRMEKLMQVEECPAG